MIKVISDKSVEEEVIAGNNNLYLPRMPEHIAQIVYIKSGGRAGSPGSVVVL